MTTWLPSPFRDSFWDIIKRLTYDQAYDSAKQIPDDDFCRSSCPVNLREAY